VQTRRWVNQSQPQTLQFAVFLLYFEAVIAFIFRQAPDVGLAIIGPNLSKLDTIDMLNNVGLFLIVIGGAAAGYLISNEKKNGYLLGIAVAGLPLLTRVLIGLRVELSDMFRDPLGLLFEIALLALILHTQSRNYVRIWFK